MTEQFIQTLIKDAAIAGDTETVTALSQMLYDIQNPVEEKHRAANNKSGYVMCDMETGKEIKRFQTVKEANEYLAKKPNNSGVSDACRSNTHNYLGYKWFYGSDFDAQ